MRKSHFLQLSVAPLFSSIPLNFRLWVSVKSCRNSMCDASDFYSFATLIFCAAANAKYNSDVTHLSGGTSMSILASKADLHRRSLAIAFLVGHLFVRCPLVKFIYI